MRSYTVKYSGRKHKIRAADCCQAFNKVTGLPLGISSGFFIHNRVSKKHVIYSRPNGETCEVIGPFKDSSKVPVS